MAQLVLAGGDGCGGAAHVAQHQAGEQREAGKRDGDEGQDAVDDLGRRAARRPGETRDRLALRVGDVGDVLLVRPAPASSIWRRPGSCRRAAIPRSTFSSMKLTRRHDRRAVVAGAQVGLGADRHRRDDRRAAERTADMSALRAARLAADSRRRGSAMAPAGIAVEPAAQQIDDWRELRAQVGRRCGSSRRAEELVFDLIGAIDDDRRSRDRRSSAAAGRCALHPLRIVVVADVASVARSVVATLSISRRMRSPRSMIAPLNSCCSRSSATSSARCAELSTATTTQMIATATTTPIGTTRLRRTRSHRDGLRSSDVRGSAPQCSHHAAILYGKHSCIAPQA